MKKNIIITISDLFEDGQWSDYNLKRYKEGYAIRGSLKEIEGEPHFNPYNLGSHKGMPPLRVPLGEGALYDADKKKVDMNFSFQTYPFDPDVRKRFIRWFGDMWDLLDGDKPVYKLF